MQRNRFSGSRRSIDTVGRPYWVGSRSSLDNDPSTGRIGPTATIDVTGLQINKGDLLAVHVFYRGNPITISVSVTGGQEWQKCTQHLGTTNNTSVFFAQFNGSWAANPVFTVTSGTESMIAVLTWWRPTDPNNRWALAQSPQLGSGAGTAFTITGVTTLDPNTVAIASISSIDDNEYTLTTPGNWYWIGNKQYRTQGGTDGALTIVGYAQAAPGSTGNVTLTQATLGADAGITTIVVFKETADPQLGAWSSRLWNARGTPASRRKFRASPRGYSEPEGTGTTINATVQDLILATLQSVVSLNTTISVAVQNLSLATFVASITRTWDIATQNLSLSTFTASITGSSSGTTINAGFQALVLSTLNAVVSVTRTIDAGVQALSLNTFVAAISRTLSVGVQNLQLTTFAASITGTPFTPGTGARTWTVLGIPIGIRF